jgi:hypothetical protein
MRLDGLRLPSGLAPDAPRYKDWLHLNLFDPPTGLVGLVNVALHGAPEDARARAVGTALVHMPGRGWLGNVEAAGLTDAAVSEEGIGLRGVALGIDPRAGVVMASARLPDDGLRLDVTAELDGPTHSVPWRVPVAGGWISWFTAPHLRLRGYVEAGGDRIDLGGAVAYHDHNWGRWRWGDDLGWEWGCFADSAGESVLVYTRITDRDHRRRGRPLLLVHAGGRRQAFAGRGVAVDYLGALVAPPRRMPGALAALHGDRAEPRLPAEVELRADDGHDSIRLRFKADAAAQIVTAEPSAPGYGFIHELAGSFEASGWMKGAKLSAEGLAMFEHVD